MFTISCPPAKGIWLGRKGENEFRTIEVEVSEWLRDYPSGTISVVYHRPDGAIYLPDVSTNNNVASWLVTATDTAIAGKGEVEYRITDGEVIGKSIKMPTMVSAAINATTDAPAPPPEDWTATAAEIIGTIGNLSDLSTEDKSNLVGAINEAAQSSSGGTSDHRQLTHRNDADQHPMSAITGLQSTLAAKGTYSKPTDGIPYNDLSSAVKESLDKADSALQEHQSLAGYATESYVQNYHDNTKQDVINDLATIRSGSALGATALQSVPNTYRTSAVQDAIDADKQDKSIIVNITQSGGTYTVDKTNAEIYAAWQANREVIAAINGGKIPCTQCDANNAYFVIPMGGDANTYATIGTIIVSTSGGTQTVTIDTSILQSSAITDTAGYYTTDTVEGALAEIGAELAGINTLIGSGVIT